jgi:hypothetical protein
MEAMEGEQRYYARKDKMTSTVEHTGEEKTSSI